MPYAGFDYSGLSPGARKGFENLIAAGVANQPAAERQRRLNEERKEAKLAAERAKYAAREGAVPSTVLGRPGDAAFNAAMLEGLGPKWKRLAQIKLNNLTAQLNKTPAQRIADATYRRFDWETPGSALKEKGWGEIGSLSAQTQGAAAARSLITFDPTNKISMTGNNFVDPETGRTLTPQQMMFLGGAGEGGSANDLFFQSELKGMGLTANSSDAQLAAGYDAVARGQQYKNQLPKRGADFGGIGNILFQKVLPAVAGFIAPPLGAAVGAATGALASRGKPIPIIVGAAGGYSAGQFLQNLAYQGPGAALSGLNPFKGILKAPTTISQAVPPSVVAGNALTRGLGAIGRGAGAVGSFAAANPYLTATTLGAGISAFNAPEPPTEEETTELYLTAFPSLQQNQQGVGSLANMAAGVPYTYEPSYTGKALGPSFMNQIERGLSTSGIRSLGPNFMSQVGLGTAAPSPSPSPSPSPGFASLDPAFMNQFERAALGLA